VVYARWIARMKPGILALINDDLITEHRAKPLGQHSDALGRVLNFVRRMPQAGKYAIVCTRPWQEWRIGVLSGRRGIGPTISDDDRFTSLAEAEHGVFLRRVRDLTQ
jgi:branched-chain amino acid transport system permease protein